MYFSLAKTPPDPDKTWSFMPQTGPFSKNPLTVIALLSKPATVFIIAVLHGVTDLLL